MEATSSTRVLRSLQSGNPWPKVNTMHLQLWQDAVLPKYLKSISDTPIQQLILTSCFIYRAHEMECFPYMFGSISRIHLVKSPWEDYEKGRQNLDGNWTILPSITVKADHCQ